MNVLPREQQARIIGCLVEGNSIRATERLTNVHRDTVMKLGLKVGQQCVNLHDRLFRDLQVATIELDEQWAFIAKKAKRVRQDDPAEYGDSWLFAAIAANQKAIISFVVGKRTAQNTQLLASDLRARIVNRPQITADGYSPYPGAIDVAFGVNVDFATITKEYVAPVADDAARRSPSSIRAVDKTVIRGNPDESKISTSYVERFNLTTRMQLRRFTRLTNAFSKKAENHAAAVALHIVHYNLCRWHETLRWTPAMALKVTDHIWSIDELLAEASAMPTTPPAPAKPPTTMRPGYRPVQLRVIRGGKVSGR
jgi:IS1 family transposase